MTRFSPFYLKYITSPAWRARRRRAIELAGNRCQMCAETSRWYEVHHNTHKNLGHEKDEDLIVLCWYCHFVATWAIRLRRWWRKGKNAIIGTLVLLAALAFCIWSVYWTTIPYWLGA